MSIEKEFHVGYVAIIGQPNVGKSTLLNSLLGQKLSIVTPKPQTTRHKILGILSGENFQIIFIDTPGLINPKYALQELMMSFAKSALRDADVILPMIDASRPEMEPSLTLKMILEFKEKPIILVINKIDIVNKGLLLPLIDSLNKLNIFKEIIPVSAATGENLNDLQKTIIKYLPVGLPLYPADTTSDKDERFFVSEIIREKIFSKFREEIPYSTTVEIEEFRENQGNMKIYIRAVIYVERESQKGIIIGKGARALREIGAAARKEIEDFIGKPVFLELFVKVNTDWRDNKKILSKLGYH
ncbi:MAG: GTPase Era [Candidatus Kryptoniota bacterium]